MSSKQSLTSFFPSLKLNEFIAFDLETTGLNPNEDYITEIAAIRFINGEEKERYATLVNPGIPMPQKVIDITGITDCMVQDAPSIDEVLPQFLDFLKSVPLVGQNIQFDYDFINQDCIKYNIELPEFILYDTLSLARIFIYFHNSFNLGSLCDYYNISITRSHRASDDALATGLLFQCLVQEAISHPLNLIQKINTVFQDSEYIHNCQLFFNLVRTAVSKNQVFGMMKSLSNYNSPENIFKAKNVSANSLLPDTPIEWFEEHGVISKKWKGYEKRLSQIDLVKDVYLAFSEDHILLAEAGTGLGKSIAYLSVGFFSAKKTKKPLVVSTHTKNLQAQLFYKDIPQLSEVLDVNINAVIYKGRHNYICQTRLENLFNNHTYLLNTDEYEAFITLLVWEWETLTGDINECNGFQMHRFKRLWSLVRCEKGFCSSNNC
ncbi:MAG: exonuclease domain-containing protein, partial [SAR202 cluster bacterium]|nr:exonuclease domain-containing protein [SAR202 cluster bacterium]